MPHASRGYANHVEEVAEKRAVMNVLEYEYETKDNSYLE